MDDPRTSIVSIGHRPPGDDPGDPYADVDLTSLPAWWRRAVAEFEAHGLRPYRPSRFVDGDPAREVVLELEAALDVNIAIRGVDVTHGDEWTVYIDGTAIGPIERRRSPDGYTIYGETSEAFATRIRKAVDESAE